MKTIVIAGAHSKVGKTTLSNALCVLLPGSVKIKIGHGTPKPGMDSFFYHLGTNFSTIAREHVGATCLIIESNSILKEISPDCTIYLPGENPKPSAAIARAKADIVRGEPVGTATAALLASRLGFDRECIDQLLTLSGAVKE